MDLLEGKQTPVLFYQALREGHGQHLTKLGIFALDQRQAKLLGQALPKLPRLRDLSFDLDGEGFVRPVLKALAAGACPELTTLVAGLFPMGDHKEEEVWKTIEVSSKRGQCAVVLPPSGENRIPTAPVVF